jgi:hypothetical protein
VGMASFLGAKPLVMAIPQGVLSDVCDRADIETDLVAAVEQPHVAKAAR